ncbi:hypothetical protein [Agathobacter sp.]
MEFSDYRVILYFKNTPPGIILKNDEFYKKYDSGFFNEIVRHDIMEMTDSETRHAYDYLDNMHDEYSDGNGLNVFNALLNVASKYLMIRDNLPVCKYDGILEWHQLVENVGEDLLVCAYLAHKSRLDGRDWRNFSWNPVIGHDNMQLNRIMQKGLSDNHYHLFGSTPAFKLIWIKLMNDFEDEEYVDALTDIDEQHLAVEKRYSGAGEHDSFTKMRFQAAIIRYFLNSYIRNMEQGDNKNYEEEIDDIQRMLEKEGDGYRYYKNLELKIEGKKLNLILPDGSFIDDYACIDLMNNEINSAFAGERYLMYKMLKGTINGKKIPDKLMNWFYIYLVIKTKFRLELIQVNEKVGFDNFTYYSKRKNAFFDKENDAWNMIKHAVRESFYTGNLHSLELRISPRETAVQNRDYIEMCDECIKRCLDEDRCNDTYYVFHFPKRSDSCIDKAYYLSFTECRHFQYRQHLEEISDQIISFRELYPEQSGRVLGIDACANELVCRPEVFGSIYRKLRQHINCNQQLRMTYHVGEEWKDVADGLRAIDETILFLNMGNGDRLGHATVLGIDIEDWYRKKNNEVWLTYQEYLDNIAWMYNKLIEFEIKDCESIKGYLESEFDQMYNKVFEDVPDMKEIEHSINLYYESWKLRGDDPSVYLTGKYVSPVIFMWYYVNSEVSNGSFIRNNKTIAKLMYLYHYSTQVRKNGSKIIHKKVNDMYISCMGKIQTGMQHKVARCGICIETNPSSNLKISTIDKYEAHPITKFYNMGLTWNEELLNECPQIHSSINTDDKGVFDTSLENEYALVGCSMEKASYNKQYVYEWLDRIRENGNQQSFKK